MKQPNTLSAMSSMQQLYPDRVRSLAMTLPLAEFVTAFAEAPILLVKLDDPEPELEVGLSRMLIEPLLGSQPDLNVLAFHTLLGNRNSEPARGSRPCESEPIDATELRRRLSHSRHFAVPIKKRAGDGSYVQRIAVGRARNKDIVLRHPSVSKFHAWFEHDPDFGLRVADAGSSNGTRRNDMSLEARKLTNVSVGDVLVFGSIQAVLCAADTLWHAVASY